MRSPDNVPRLGLEWALRLTAIGVLAWLIWRELHPPLVTRVAVVRAAALGEVLPRWTVGAAPDSLHVAASHVPDGTTRDWLVALRRSGTDVGWSGPELVPLAVDLEPVASPHGGVRVLVAAPHGARVTVEDDLGTVGEALSAAGGARVLVPLIAGSARVSVGDAAAGSSALDSLLLRPVLLLARAGWEGRFLASALLERGWQVETRYQVAPGLAATAGARRPIDTASYAAVVVLDTSGARDARAIARYVRSGGGLVLASEGARVPVLSALAAGRPGDRLPPRIGTPADSMSRNSLAILPIVSLSENAVVLEKRGTHTAVAARRVGHGRVVQSGYEESWRWRMAGGDGSPEAHARWWSAVVAAAARATTAVEGGERLDPAPLAQLNAALGPPVPPPARAREPESGLPARWPLALLLLALLAEWGSRRFRGAT